MNFEDFQKFLEQARKTFVCLRCGECCFAWAVRMPDGSMKPERRNCRYLIPRRKEGGQWLQAICQIHDSPEYPWECREAVLGPWLCPLGLATWDLIQKENLEDELPEFVQKALVAWRQLREGKDGERQ